MHQPPSCRRGRSMNTSTAAELTELLEALCEDRMTAQQHARLEEAVVKDPQARRMYLDYIDLHGMLHWDAAANPDVMSAVAATASPSAALETAAVSRRSRLLWAGGGFAAAAVLVALFLLSRPTVGPDHAPQNSIITETEENGRPAGPESNAIHEPVVIGEVREPAPNGVPEEAIADIEPGGIRNDIAADSSASRLGIVAVIDEQIAASWEEAGIQPSETADDAEWIRRIYLDLAGHIPPPETVVAFLDDDEADKRQRLIDDLLSHADTSRHFATVWTNLLIGRRTSAEIDREGLHRFLERQFRVNDPWNETVAELVAAEGSSTENGAANFLLAHMNNQAVPATAVTARCFLGMQVQCTQCHKHPFYQEWGQEQFWEFNSFFQQTQVVRHTVEDPETGAQQFSHLELVSQDVGGPTWYETRAGEMKVAYPRFNGVDVDFEPETNRRRELAKLLASGDNPQLARAFVNRMWAHFFGYGFTNPVDDMGPHNEPSHPELLERLSDEFVKSGYDVKQLCRVICSSRPYQLSSRIAEENSVDNPSLGDPPYFSRMYVKPLTAEQVFDSLLVATQADRAERYFTGEADERRQAWLAQFFTAEQTEENCESSTFDGAVPQALTLMNGELVQQAVSGAPGTRLGEVLARPIDETEKIRALSLAALSRYPTAGEMQAIRELLRRIVRSQTLAGNGVDSRTAVNDALRDVFWAYLNSSEFVVNH
ncbi:MAG: DUF1553 domain-containing protein [Planctomycetota bacterium]|nr:MAG: DUF1553 domain-containing protein [Planctomycetota bacterium]